jgi:peptidoglycan/xylan/chitin deacetylase (PgdA/CDA1 family)
MRRTVRAAGAVIGAARGCLNRTGFDRPGLVIVAYHRIDSHGGGLAVSRDEFFAQLDWIAEAALPVVDVSGANEGAAETRIALTFDDGYRSVAEVAWPAIKERGWPATLYAVSRTLDDGSPFGWDAGTDATDASLIDRSILGGLAAEGMTIGSHTRTHRFLPRLPLDRVERELEDSRRELEDAIGRAVTTFSYPKGGWNGAIRRLVQRAGYETAVTMDRGRNDPGHDRLTLRRHPADEDLTTFVRSIRGCYDFLRPIDRWRAHGLSAATAALA